MRSAAEALGAGAEEDVQYEVLATPKKKTLGLFGGSDAKVRAYVEQPDPAPKKHARQKPEKAEKPEKTDRPAPAEKAERVERPQPQKKPQQPKSPEAPEVPGVPVEELDPASPASKAAAYLTAVLEKLGCTQVTMRVAALDNGARIDLDGEGLGVVIGRRGETLDALQYLTSLAANTGAGYYRVSLNIGNYREKREETLRNLARRTASQVQRTGRSRTLEPMNPYERRIIHTTVQEMEGVVSNSIGDGSNRRVVISTTGRPPRGDRASRPPRQHSDAPAREPKQDASDLPLYGKIR